MGPAQRHVCICKVNEINVFDNLTLELYNMPKKQPVGPAANYKEDIP